MISHKRKRGTLPTKKWGFSVTMFILLALLAIYAGRNEKSDSPSSEYSIVGYGPVVKPMTSPRLDDFTAESVYFIFQPWAARNLHKIVEGCFALDVYGARYIVSWDSPKWVVLEIYERGYIREAYLFGPETLCIGVCSYEFDWSQEPYGYHKIQIVARELVPLSP